MVESQPSKLLVAGSIPVSRSTFASGVAASFGSAGVSPGQVGSSPQEPFPELTDAREWRKTFRGLPRRSLRGQRGRRSKRRRADVAQLAERVLGKDEVTSSILVIGSRLRSLAPPSSFVSAGQRAKAVAP